MTDAEDDAVTIPIQKTSKTPEPKRPIWVDFALLGLFVSAALMVLYGFGVF